MQNTNSSKHFLINASPLFLVLFIDSMGLGLVFPILNAILFDPSVHFFSGFISNTTLNFLYGLTIGTFMLCWFFGAAFLGDLSDQIGRKKSLMICLSGAAIGYLCSAFAILFSSFYLLILGRIIAGFTAGSQSIAQAAIVDLSSTEHKARNLGFILFFCSLGFAFGPIIGGVLSASSLVPWFNYALPFYFAAAISLLNAILLHLFFRETFLSKHKIKLKFNHAMYIFISAFKHDRIRQLSLIFLIMMFGWSGFYSFISMYLLKIYHFSALKNGFYMGLMGVGFGIGTGFLIEPLTKRFSLKQCTIAGILFASASTIFTIFAPKEIYVWIHVIIVAIAIAVSYSTILTLFSNQVDKEAQGWIMGITGAIMAFAFGINGFALGFLANISPAIPLLISAGWLFVSAILMIGIYRPALRFNKVDASIETQVLD